MQTPTRLIEALSVAFNWDAQTITSRLSESNLSYSHIGARVSHLRRVFPNCWSEFLKTRKTALTCSRSQFQALVRSYYRKRAEARFEVNLARAFEKRYGKAESMRLMGIKERSLLNSATVVGRLMETEKISMGVIVPKKRAWVLVSNHDYYCKWYERIGRLSEMIGFISRNCRDKVLSEKWISDILSSDARRERNLLRALDRLESIKSYGGSDELQHALLRCRSPILRHNESNWQEWLDHRAGIGGAEGRKKAA